MKKVVMAIMLYTLLYAAVFAQKEDEFKTDGKGTITGYEGWDTAIVIPAQIGGMQVTAIGDGAFKNMGITSLTLPAGLRRIGNEAFKDNKLTSLTILGGVSFIGDYAFYNNQLTTLTVGSNTFVVIGEYAFSRNKLTRLTMNGNAGISISTRAFSSNQLAGITLGNNVSIDEYAFSNNQLTSITAGDKVTIKTYAFYENKLTNLTVGSGGFIAARAFFSSGNDKLKNVVLGAGTTIDRDAFRFGNYSRSLSVYYDYMCNGRKAGTYDNLALYAEKTEGDYKFIQTKYGVVITGYTGNEGSRLQIPAKLGGVQVTGIGDSVFREKNISRMQLPEGLVFIDNNAFAQNQMTNVTIPNSVTVIGSGVFSNCQNLTSIIIPDSVTSSIGEKTFSGCTSLTGATIGTGVTSIGDAPFYSCTSLTAINVNTANTAYSSQDGVLYNRSKATLIQYPAGKTGSFDIPGSVTSIGDRAFNGSGNLESITIPGSVTKIGDEAFGRCGKLTAINVDSANKTYGSEDGVLYMLDYNRKRILVRYPGGKRGALTIPNSVDTIGKNAFTGCSTLTSVTIPSKSYYAIDSRAFSNCNNLTSVTFQGSIKSATGYGYFANDAFDGDLRTKFYANDSTNGTPGTYKRTSGSTTWTRQ